jgi:hypothetical protein
MHRRDFIFGTMKLLGGLAATSASFADQPRDHTRVEVHLASLEPAAIIPKNFCGLGYEMSSVATSRLLSGENRAYVQLVRNLSPGGMLRFGGIVSDYTRYEPDGESRAEREDTVITKRDLEQVASFLREVGWTAIWSLNFGRGSLEDAIGEARDVAAILGDRLYAIELGNEVNGYGLGDRPRRKSPYTFETYLPEYREWHAAISAAVGGLRFAAPDVAGAVDWVEQLAQNGAGQVQLLTLHYYRNGQRRATAEQLRLPDPALADKLSRMQQASLASGIPWRMCETNSFSGGGKPGLSDSLLGALWTLDYMLLLAMYGCAGINLETGVNQLGFVSSYSPIQDDGKGHNFAGVPYYGMLAFAVAVANLPEIYRLNLEGAPSTVTTYALGAGKKPRAVVIVNRDQKFVAEVSMRGLRLGPCRAMRLAASSAGGETAVTLADAAVGAEGNWKSVWSEKVHGDRIVVAPMSAVVLRTATLA